jgi:single-strand selective monofunctional uracil DNA glycosylase
LDLLDIADELVARLRRLRFAEPVTHVYNPLVYARDMYSAYIERFGRGRREVVFFGMNPGPWGMAQTGVPFGEVTAVRDWMVLKGRIGRPQSEHPKVRIRGLECHRSEVSGQRLWGWARDAFGTAEAFFARFFVANYCPLLFLEISGRNRTPDKLPADERLPLLAACDEAMRQTVEALQPRYVIGVGGFAAGRARQALAGLDVTIGEILHPSPASPAANRGWREAAVRQLRAMGIDVPEAATTKRPHAVQVRSSTSR